MNGITIDFAPDGTARCLYGELIDLRSLGRLRITRASVVEFDNDLTVWQVLDPQDGRVLHQDPSREACLDWEREHLIP